MKITFPNFLSILRILLIIPILILLFFKLYFIAFLLFIFASITDFLDGYFARKFNNQTHLGAFLDLLADKLLVSSLLIWFVFLSSSLIIFVSSLVIILREITISSLRLFFFSNSNNTNFGVDYFGKLKTFFQMTSVSLLIILPESNILFFIPKYLLLISAIFSIVSLINYVFKWQKKNSIIF